MLFLLIFFAGNAYLVSAGKTLIMSNLVYRHGARSPRAIYPNDPHQVDFWPDGLGRLTQYGMRLEYNLGKFFRERYVVQNKLINEQYRHKDVYIRSSDVERCIESAESQLAGLYPPKGYQVWNDKIPWQPIPIHTFPKSEDVLLRPASSVPCPRLKQKWAAIRETDEFKKKLHETKSLLSILSNHSGMAVDFDNLYYVTDTIHCEVAEGLEIPKWIQPIWKEAAGLEDWMHVIHYSGDDEIGALLGGHLLWTMNDNMKRMTKHDEGVHKMNIFSGHDTTLLALCAAFGFKCHLPAYAASIMVELYQSDSGEYTVEIHYRLDDTNRVVPLKINHCGYSCPLDKFVELTSKRTTGDRSKICGLKEEEVGYFYYYGSTGRIVMLLLGWSFVIVVMGLFAKRSSYFCRLRGKKAIEDKEMLI